MYQRLCKILEHAETCKGYFKLKLEWRDADKIFKPGQFIEIKVNNTSDPLLRRPFSTFDADESGIYVVYKVIGKGTEELSSKKINENLDIIAPLGNGYNISNLSSKKVILVGGGTGVASLFYLAKILEKNNIDFAAYFGFKNKEHIFCVNDLKNFQHTINIITEDGSMGNKGFATQFIKNIDDAQIFACGPEAMLKNIPKNKNTQFSLEAYMACGTGICSGCVVKIKNSEDFDYKRVCVDGPIFFAKDILWE